MIVYNVNYTPAVYKALKKIDKPTRNMILSWIGKNLDGCVNPRQHGKPLTANRSGQWRYHVGDYRLIAEIQDDKIIILILSIGHRREIY